MSKKKGRYEKLMNEIGGFYNSKEHPDLTQEIDRLSLSILNDMHSDSDGVVF